MSPGFARRPIESRHHHQAPPLRRGLPVLLVSAEWPQKLIRVRRRPPGRPGEHRGGDTHDGPMCPPFPARARPGEIRAKPKNARAVCAGDWTISATTRMVEQSNIFLPEKTGRGVRDGGIRESGRLSTQTREASANPLDRRDRDCRGSDAPAKRARNRRRPGTGARLPGRREATPCNGRTALTPKPDAARRSCAAGLGSNRSSPARS